MATSSYTGIGPGSILLTSDPTDAAAWVDLGNHENVTASLGARTGWSNSANSGDLPIGNSLRKLSASPMVEAELYDQSIANMKEFMAQHLDYVTVTDDQGTSTDTSDDITYEALVARPNSGLITPFTLAFIPEHQRDAGIDAENAFYLPAAFIESLDQLFQYGRLQEGENNNPVSVTFRACRGDAATLGTNSSYIYGQPMAEGLDTWVLPAA